MAKIQVIEEPKRAVDLGGRAVVERWVEIQDAHIISRK